MKKYSFNESWRFYKDGYEDAEKVVNLPHDAMLSEKRYKGCVTGNGCAFFEGGKYIYTKIFEAPEEYRDKYVAFEFEGVYKNAEVYVNDQLAAKRPYGYSNFYVEVGKYLKYGEKNEICVIADNSALIQVRVFHIPEFCIFQGNFLFTSISFNNFFPFIHNLCPDFYCRIQGFIFIIFSAHM